MYYEKLENKHLNVSCCFDKIIDDSFYMGPHYHPRVEIMYAQEGEFECEIYNDNISDASYVTYQIPTKSFIILNPNTVHRLKIKKDTSTRLLNIEFSLNSTDLSDNDIARKIFITNNTALIDSCSGLNSFIKDKKGYAIIFDDFTFGKQLKKYIKLMDLVLLSNEQKIELNLILYHMILEFSKCCHSHYSKNKTGIKYLSLATDYIEKNYSKKISVDDIAINSGVSKFYLQKLFREYKNTSINTFLNNYRIEKCKTLLSTTDLSINEIATMTGFMNRQTLLYTFKNTVGISPQKYRTMIENQIIDVQPSKKDRDATVEIKN